MREFIRNSKSQGLMLATSVGQKVAARAQTDGANLSHSRWTRTNHGLGQFEVLAGSASQK
jgi:hypothetical protein